MPAVPKAMVSRESRNVNFGGKGSFAMKHRAQPVSEKMNGREKAALRDGHQSVFAHHRQ